MRLGNKIQLYSSVLFAVLMILMNLSIFLLFNRLTLRSEMGQIEAKARTIAEGVTNAAGQIPTEELLRSYVPLEGMLRIVMESGDGFPPVTSLGESSLSLLKAAHSPDERTEVVRHGSNRYVDVSLPVIWKDGGVANVQLTESLRETDENLRVLRIVLLAVTGAAMIPVVISNRVLSRLITVPITSMIGTMRDIRESGRFKRLELHRSSKDELVEMGVTFNRMIDLLESNFDRQDQFISNASHELKTPLTVIESYASLLQRKGLERPELFQESIDAIHSEAIRMREMTEQLLLLAGSNEHMIVKWERIDLVALAQESSKALHNAYRRDIHVEADSAVMGYADGKLLKQLLFILLDNALKYSDEPVTVYVGQTGGEVWIRIMDRGIGIPRSLLPKVFDRFYRVDQARSKARGGSGLGLSLARHIADAIGATIELESLESVGTTVTVRLAKSPA